MPRDGGLLREVEDRLPALGDLGGELHVLGAERGDDDGDPVPDRPVDQLQRLAPPGAARVGQRVVLALVVQDLAAPDRPADLDQLAGPAHRRVVGDAVPALDHLRAGGAQAEGEPPAGHVVQARGGHRGQRRGATVDRQDPARDLQFPRPRGDEAKLADRVEGARLRHEHDLQPGALVVGQPGDRLCEPAGVVQHHPQPHQAIVATGTATRQAGPSAARVGELARPPGAPRLLLLSGRRVGLGTIWCG